MGEKQNFEGPKNAIKILIFACRYMFLFLFAAILQKCASGSYGKHNFANCIFDAKSHQDLSLTSCLHFARPVPSEMKITKISPVRFLGRPGGMRGGAGGEFRGG